MTDQEINNAIAEKFLTLSFSPDKNWVLINSEWVPIPQFTADPAACALVLDEIERLGWWYQLEYWPGPVTYWCAISMLPDSSTCAFGDTRYRAVCLAVLRAVGVEI